MDKVRFNFWLINFLIPETKPGDVLMMDNAAFHQSEETKTLIKNAGGELLFLPPYSPDLNPIEKCWANIKGFIKRSKHRFESLADAIDEAFRLDRFKIN